MTKNNSENSSEEKSEVKVSSNMPRERVPWRSIVALCVLVYINLLNYMDRFTIASVLNDIIHWFSISKKTAGLLQTVFVCSYMIFAPVFGFLGDRFSRKYIMAFGITIWAITTFIGSFMGKDDFWWFFALRGLVGIGEASYSTVAPTIIADLFVGNQRSVALSVFYFAIPCGSGLGYIIGSRVAKSLGAWYWALRPFPKMVLCKNSDVKIQVTPGLGIIAVVLSIIVLHEPKRGAKEVVASGAVSDIDDLSESLVIENHQSYLADLRQILNVPSFVWSTAGFTCISFVVGALAWWAPDFAYFAQQAHSYDVKRTQSSVSYIFGIVTFVSGVIGVWTGAEFARRWKATNQQADALVCAIGIISAIPFLFFSLYLADKYIILTWVLIGIGEILMCMNWAPNGDLLLYVIPPNCRSTAEAVQIVFIHVLGDAFSPFVVGAISDSYAGKNVDENNFHLKHLGLLYGLYITPFVCILGAFCYFRCAKHVPGDKAKAEQETLQQADVVTPESLDSIPRNHTNFNPQQNIVVPDIYAEVENTQVEVPDTDLLFSKTGRNAVA